MSYYLKIKSKRKLLTFKEVVRDSSYFDENTYDLSYKFFTNFNENSYNLS